MSVEFDWIGRANRLLTISGAGSLSDFRYTFDSNSNIARIQEEGGPTPVGDMHYRYDAVNRLTAATQPAGPMPFTRIMPGTFSSSQ